MTPAQAQKSQWDVIVIGTGMGGGVAGRRLAEKGAKVLFIEKGPAGYLGEEQGLNAVIADPLARQLRGIWPKPIEAHIDGKVAQFFGPIGSGVGGSSVFYAGTLERPERHDLEDMADRPHPTGGWPIGYDGFAPYYDQAEDMFFIHGDPDPLSSETTPALRSLPKLSTGEALMADNFRARGLHPYRQHVAARFLEGCKGCIGHKCPRRCKMDARSAGVEPALDSGNASLLDRCDVAEIIDENGVVTGVKTLQEGQEIILSARYYVLAAGTLGSARLLLSSKGSHSEGCANSSGQVGRGLMFHLNEIFAVWPRRGQEFAGATKSIMLRDFYFRDGLRLGVIQSMGLEAGYGNIVHYLNGIYDRSFLRRFKGVRNLTRIPALIASKILGDAKVFVGLMEDLAYDKNRVVLHQDDPEILTFEYHISDELRQRRRAFRKYIRKAFGWRKTMFFSTQPELNFGHPCGTLRFGTDSETSVLNAECRAHDLDNLYVADASFMPSSMGVNPSLTIAANALRVADIIAVRLQRKGKDHG